LSRRDDLIITGGENVYPAEVEAALEADPWVLEACVVGVPDATWGAVVAAAIVVRPGAWPNDDALLAPLRTRLAGYKLPRRWLRVPALPRTATGKLRRDVVLRWMRAAAG
jgi:acyl-CoA synthetase (AMP-forming)/AMP-acid ligase II